MQLISCCLGDFRRLRSRSYSENYLITLENPTWPKNLVFTYYSVVNWQRKT